MAAVMMIFLVAMIAFAIDSGYMLTVRTELQRSADAGAMAGAAGLINGVPAARAEALRFVRMNSAGARTISNSDVTVEFGHWNKSTKTFTIVADDPSAVRVSRGTTRCSSAACSGGGTSPARRKPSRFISLATSCSRWTTPPR
jgi:uncharacterized membrane protein